MRCCVQNCVNDDLKKTNKRNGITFHKLPKDPVQCAAWLKILADAGCRLSKWLVVCSDHFKSEDFDETRPNQRRVKSGAVPSVMAPFNQDELKVCRVCLAFDIKMYDMKNFKYSEMFQNITGILASDKESIHHICWECAARLTAAAAFRDKALLSDTLLKDVVHINKSDIATLKQNYTSLKSSLTVHTAFTVDIESQNTISENKQTEILLNDETFVKERKPKIRVADEEKEMDFEEYEPWIDVPMKFEIESDPLTENDINIKHRKNDSTLRESSEDEIRNTDEQINNKQKIISVYKTTNVPIVNDDGNVALVDEKEQKPRLDEVIFTFEEESSSDEDRSTADEKPVIKAKKKINRKAGATEKRRRLTDKIKEKIIALKKEGLGVREISRETGLSVASVDRWWSRYRKNGYTYRKSTTAENDQSYTKQNYQYNTSEPGKEMGACSEVVRQRLHEAGFEHILMKKPERNANTELIINEHKANHDDLKQRIIALKQEGVTNCRIAYLLDTSRITVRKWWDRWCDKGHMQNLKGTGRKRKTTPEEDQLLIERVMQEQTVHTPSLAMELGISPACLRRRLKGAGFKHMERKAYVPLKAGRSHKVDEELKQQILSMKLNGVSVTDIANQFGVPRTTIYQWWQRWCKENNIKVTSDNNTSTSTEQEQSGTEGANGEMSLQTPAILSSQKTLWQKLPDVECAPLNSSLHGDC